MTVEIGVLMALIVSVAGLAAQWGSTKAEVRALKDQIVLKADSKDVTALDHRIDEKASRETVAHVERTLTEFKTSVVGALSKIEVKLDTYFAPRAPRSED